MDQYQVQEGCRMYSREQRVKAIELYIKYGKRAPPVVAELGYPNRHSLASWYREYASCQEAGVEYMPPGRPSRMAKFTPEEKRRAVDHFLEHGRSLARTAECLGYPSRQTLSSWVDELAPGSKVRKVSAPGRRAVPEADKIRAVEDLCTRTATAGEVAARYGVGRTAAYAWKYEFLGKGGGCSLKDYTSDLPEDLEELRGMYLDLRREVARLRLEKDILEGTAELLKKDRGIDPKNLTNREKAQLIDALRDAGYALRDLLGALSIAKSSYEYQRGALGAPDKYEAARAAVAEEFAAVGGSRGYRYIHRRLSQRGDCPAVGEKKVRELMAQAQCRVAYARKPRRRYSSYGGEISEAPANLVNRDFHADAPNKLWLTDITEFRLPIKGAPKVYLSPILDCFDGKLPAWSIGTSPNAELANSSLRAACETLAEGEAPCCHNDRGCHYRWPGWIAICEEHGITRSMSRKGCSPDNSACEGLFGRLKNEFFYHRDWSGTTVDEFIGQLDAYLRYYNEDRIKQSLGWMSPNQYRRSLGIAA